MNLIKIALTALLITQAQAFEPDKQKHITATAAISFTASSIASSKNFTPLESTLIGIGTGMLVGILKEATDDSFSGGDLKADLLGSCIGVVPLLVYTW
jgi:hypothetical protein